MSFNSAAGLLRKPMIAPVSLGATGSGGKTSKIIDRAGYEDVGITFEYGAISATNATVAVNLKDGDTTGALANVTGALILGLTLAAAGIGATSSRVSDVSKNVAKSIQYIGLKRRDTADSVFRGKSTYPVEQPRVVSGMGAEEAPKGFNGSFAH